MKSSILLLIVAIDQISSSADKIDPELYSVLLAKGASKNVFVMMKGGTSDVIRRINSRSYPTRESKIRALTSSLVRNADFSQQNVLQFLNAISFKNFDTFPISNEIYIKGADLSIVNAIANFPNVEKIREEELMYITKPEEPIEIREEKEAEWGVKAIRADEVWKDYKIDGTGIVTAIIDSGVNVDHDDLRENFRGGEYSWYDPTPWPFNTAKPSDNVGHGTHVCGTVSGKNGIGVAPGSKWIACRGCTTITCAEPFLKKCGEWALCPWKSGGGWRRDKCDAGKAPHVVNNSWGGSEGRDFYNEIIAAWSAVNIIPVFAVGNDGDKCSTLGSPGDQAGVIGVGATTNTNSVAKFSSRGPTEDGRLKPDLAAPGAAIISASNTGKTGRRKMSGTSMASPHVAGAVALLKCVRANMTTEEVRGYLLSQSRPTVPTGKSCGSGKDEIEDSKYPNYMVGQGLIDIYNSFLEASGIPIVAPGSS